MLLVRGNAIVSANESLRDQFGRDEGFVVRIIIRSVVTAFVLLGSALALAGPAVAAPAQPYRYNDCVDFGNGYVSCFSGHGTFVENQSASGTTLYRVSGTSADQITLNGEVVAQYSNKQTFVLVQRGGQDQVVHNNGDGSFTFPDFGCTYKFNYTFANGEIRHDVYDIRCTP